MEFDMHKKKCGDSFERIEAQLALQNRALFGDELECGLMKMVQDMHAPFVSSKALIRFGKWVIVGSITLVGSIYTLVKLLKEIR